MQVSLRGNINIPVFHPLYQILILTKDSKAIKSAYTTFDSCMKPNDDWLPLGLGWAKKWRYVKDFLQILDDHNIRYKEMRGENGVGRTGKPFKDFCILIEFENFYNL